MTTAITAVVGATGFIGSAVLTALRDQSLPSLAFTRRTPPVTPDGALAPGVGEASAIVWAAASVNPALAESRPDLVDADLRALTRLVDALGRSSSTARLVLLSSGGTVYDPSGSVPYRESSRCSPRGAYGRSKLAAESLVLRSQAPVVLRVANAYGPGQPVSPGQGVIAHWLHAIDRGDPVTLFGPAETARDYVHVDDVVDAILAATTVERPPDVANIGSGAPTTLAGLLEAVGRVAGPFIVEHAGSRSFDVSRTWLDVSLAAQTLGWRPRITLEDGLDSTWRAIGGHRARREVSGPRQPEA